jgi:hypothetical protein
MALRAIQRDSFLSKIEANLQSFRDDLQAERQHRSMKKIRRDGDFWVLSATQAATDTPVAVLSKLHDRLCVFAARVNEYFCQSISRLEYASTMLFVEIARGFFLPFCTVAVAAIARVRALMRRLCLNLTNCLLEVADDIKKDLSTLENSKKVHLAPLWTPAQVITFQEQGLWQQPLLDSDSISSKAASASDRREQQCRASWKALGIPTRKRRQANTGQVSLDQEGKESIENDDDNDNGQDRADSGAEPTPSLLAADAKHDNDIGEAVEGAEESSLALDRSNVVASSASVDIDQNLSLVQELQMEKKRKKSKEKDSKRTAEKSDKKKKKAKKSKKADFFDDLFT